VGKDGLVVACGVGKVVIKEVQFDSSRRMTVEEYICGHKVGEGEVLDNSYRNFASLMVLYLFCL